MIDKKTINEIRKKNGNENFTQKEMLWYLIHKLDKVDEKLTKQINVLFSKKADKKLVYTIFTTLIGLITALIILIS